MADAYTCGMVLPRPMILRYLPAALAAAALLAVVSPAQAQWKWKDGRGQVHVSDMPPPRDVPDKDILQRPGAVVKRQAAMAASAASAASAAGPVPKALLDPELEARRAKAEAEQKAKAKADEDRNTAIREENCRKARGQLAALQTGQRIARITPQGERIILDDKGRDEEAAIARRVVETDCR